MSSPHRSLRSNKLRAPLKFKNKLHFYPHDFGIFQSTSSDDYCMPDFAFLNLDRPTFPVQKGSFSLFLKLQTYSLLHKVTKRLILYTLFIMPTFTSVRASPITRE